MKWYAIKNKKTGLFYNSVGGGKWVALEKARLFKRKNDISSFMTWNDVPKYLKSGTVTGLSYFDNTNPNTWKLMVTPSKDFKVVEIELREVSDSRQMKA